MLRPRRYALPVADDTRAEQLADPSSDPMGGMGRSRRATARSLTQRWDWKLGEI